MAIPKILMGYKFYKTDKNHTAIKREFLKLGYTVADLARTGDDIPDLLVGKYGVDTQIEIKTEEGTLSPGQKEYHELWRGKQPEVVRNAAEVFAFDQRLYCAYAPFLEHRLAAKGKP